MINVSNIAISPYLRELGISPALTGYGYLMCAVAMVIDFDKNRKLSMTRDIYPKIADAYGVSPRNVERNIRNAISVGFERANPEKFREIFSFTYLRERQKPTNSEFIFGLADYIICQNN